MIGESGDKRFVVFWYTGRMGWMVRGKKSVEKAVESPFAYETDIANLYRNMQPRWTGLPQGMTIRRVLVCKLTPKDVIVGH
jgi:hypothetical protein